MRQDGIVYLMYHEIELEGRPLCQSEPGYVRYVLREADFRKQIELLKSSGTRGVSVSDALSGKHSGKIAITFDDGCETDLIVAAPLLRSAGFGATFYITLGFLNRPGYMIPQQVRELSDAGFDIGCHSMTHAYLSDLTGPGLTREVAEAKTQLEEIIGRPVYNFSCPGGRWSPKVAEEARRAGYRSVATSRIGLNFRTSDPFQLSRVAVMRGLPANAFEKLCGGHGLWRRQMRNSLQTTTHKILGNAFYDRLRGIILGGKA